MCNHESCHVAIKQRWDAKSSACPETRFRHPWGSGSVGDAIINFSFYLFFSQSVTQKNPKTTAKMCCKGFLKIMMFLFNGGIFVSRKLNCSLFISSQTHKVWVPFVHWSDCLSLKPVPRMHLYLYLLFFFFFYNCWSLRSCEYPTMKGWTCGAESLSPPTGNSRSLLNMNPERSFVFNWPPI